VYTVVYNLTLKITHVCVYVTSEDVSPVTTYYAAVRLAIHCSAQPHTFWFSS